MTPSVLSTSPYPKLQAFSPLSCCPFPALPVASPTIHVSNPPVKRTPPRGIATTIRHDPRNHNSLYPPTSQFVFQISVQKRIVHVLRDDRRVGSNKVLYCWYEFGFGRADVNRALRTPFAHELVGNGGFEVRRWVAVLSENLGETMRLEKL